MAANYLTENNFKSSLPSWTYQSSMPTYGISEVTTVSHNTSNAIGVAASTFMYFLTATTVKTVTLPSSSTAKKGETHLFISTGGGIKIYASSSQVIKTAGGTTYNSTFTLANTECLVTAVYDGSNWWVHPWKIR